MRWLGFVLVSSLVWCAAPARAQASGSNKVAAEALFTEGRQLAQSGRCDEAIPKFQASQKLDPGVGTLLNLAECYEKVGRTASAWAEYREVISLARVAGSKEREELATERAKALESTLSRLVVSVSPGAGDPALLSITRNGVALEAAELGVAIPVDPGRHVIEVTAPGKQKWTETIEVGAAADSKSLEIPALADEVGGEEPAPVAAAGAPSASDDGSGQRTIGLVVAGVGVVGVAAGVVFGLNASSKWDEAKASCSDYPFGCGADGVSLADEASSAATLSTIGFIVGGVCLAGGATLWLTAGSSEEKAVSLGVGPGTLRLKGRF